MNHKFHTKMKYFFEFKIEKNYFFGMKIGKKNLEKKTVAKNLKIRKIKKIKIKTILKIKNVKM